MSCNGQTAFIRTRMASCAQRTHTKYAGRLLAARRLYEKKVKWLTASLTLIDIHLCSYLKIAIVKKNWASLNHGDC